MKGEVLGCLHGKNKTLYCIRVAENKDLVLQTPEVTPLSPHRCWINIAFPHLWAPFVSFHCHSLCSFCNTLTKSLTYIFPFSHPPQPLATTFYFLFPFNQLFFFNPPVKWHHTTNLALITSILCSEGDILGTWDMWYDLGEISEDLSSFLQVLFCLLFFARWKENISNNWNSIPTFPVEVQKWKEGRKKSRNKRGKEEGRKD